ncbi:MAG: hypothetical protein U0R19_24980 [Bryobacteraceae bacterium]
MPVESHPLFPPLPEEPLLWRYLDFAKFIALLETSSLFFCRADKLEDSWEGSIADLNSKARERMYSELPPTLRDSTSEMFSSMGLRLRKLTFICCWHASLHESAAMWAHYSRGQNGIAIRTSYRRLSESLKRAPQSIYVGRVRYMDYSTDPVPTGFTFGPYLCKRSGFEHEQEVRAIIQQLTSLKAPVLETGDGISITIPLDVLVEAIFVAPTTPTWVLQTVQAIVARFGLNVEVRRSDLDRDPVY